MGDYLLSQRGQLSLAIVLWVGAMSTSDRKEEVGLSVLTWETLSVEMPVFCLCSYDFTCQTYQLNTANNPCVLRRSKKWVSHPRALQPGILLCIYCEIDVCYAAVYGFRFFFLFCGLLYQSCNYYVTDLIFSLFFLNCSSFHFIFFLNFVLFLRLRD